MQFVIVACALLGVALGQYAGYTGYPGYAGYAGYGAYPGYGGYGGYPYAGYQGYTGYKGYPTLPGFAPIKPVVTKPIVDAKVPVVVPVAAKTWAGPYAAIRSQTNANAPDGSYSYSYETENGIAAAESGSPRSTPEGTEEVVVGEYAYTSPEGVPVHVRYTADANGFHPEIISTLYGGYYGAGRALPVDAAVVPVETAEKAEESKEEAEKKDE